MKYLMNWIEKELNPEKHISSKTTSSEYYYFYGAKVRLSDHMTGHEDNDLEIICVRDLAGKNKQFLIKEGYSPNMVSVPDVKTLKIVLMTFIFQFKNKYQNTQIKLSVNQENTKIAFNMCIDKLINGECLSTNDLHDVNSYLSNVCPQWMSINEKVRTAFLHLLKNKISIENVIDIINLEFPNKNAANVWQNKSPEENINKVLQYLPNDYNIESTPIREYDPITSESTEYKKLINKYNDYKTIGFNNLTDDDKDKFINTFGTLIVKDTLGLYSKLTTGQRKTLRNLVKNNLPYKEILCFFNNTFIRKKKSLTPTTTLLVPIVNKFLKMYNIGIIKYPNESDFDTTYYTNFVNEHEEIIDDNVQERTSIKNNKELNDNMTSSIEENIENDSIIEFNHDTDKTIKETYKYASAEFIDIPDIHEMFDNNQINILDEVIKKINDTDNFTSFETRRITDVFAKHYSDIWNKLTWTQKELCSSIITEERMNLNETDFIINKVFDKNSFNWPVTEQCRKDIKMYCQQIKESRMAA